MLARRKHGIKHDTHDLLVAIVGTEWLGGQKVPASETLYITR